MELVAGKRGGETPPWRKAETGSQEGDQRGRVLQCRGYTPCVEVPLRCSEIGHIQRRGNVYAAAQSARHWAVVGVDAVSPLGCLPLRRRELEMVDDVNAPDDQHVAVLFDFPTGIGRESASASRNAARFQRATQGARQSTSRSGHDIIQGGGVRLVRFGINAVVCCYF